MNVGLNQNIRFLNPEKLEQVTPPLRQEVIKQLNQSQSHAGSELILETKDGFVKSVDLKDYLARPDNYKDAARSFFSVEVAGKSVVVELAQLNKENILGALDRALGRLESGPLQGVASGDFLRSVSGLVAQIRGGAKPTVEEDKSKAYTLDPAREGTTPPAEAVDSRTARALDTAMDLTDKGPKLDPAARKAQIIETTLKALGGEAYTKLPQPQQQALQKLLSSFSLKELRAVEVQGFGGAASGDGITGSGSEGHYTNNVLSSVRQLLITGRINAEVLDSLNHLQQAPLAPELIPQRLGLLRSTLQDIAFPDKINQHAKGTCAATTVQILLALKEPARYVSILTDLASPGGKVSDGLFKDKSDHLIRVKGTSTDDSSGRSVSGRLLQPALMEYADGKKLHYDNEKDKHSNKAGGMTDPQVDHLLQGLFGKQTYTTLSDSKHTGKLMPQLEQALAAGQSVPAGGDWGDGSHEFLVTGIDKAKDKVFILNPWGEAESMSLKEFAMQVDAISIPKAKNAGNPLQALQSLPGALKDTNTYKALDPAKYRTLATHFAFDPGLKALPQDQQTKLMAEFKRFKLSAYQPHLSTLAKGGGKYINELLKSLATCKDMISAAKEVGIFTAVQTAEAGGKIDGTLARRILDSPARNYLKLSDFRDLNRALKSSAMDFAKIEGYLKLADEGKKVQTELEAKLKGLGVKPKTTSRLMALVRSSVVGDQLLVRLSAVTDKKQADRAAVLYAAINSISLNDDASLNGSPLLKKVLDLKPEVSFSDKRFKALIQALGADDPDKLKALIELQKPAK